MRIYLSAGELSGDHLGASVARVLRARSPDIRLEGYGGPQMADAGVEILYPLPDLAVMGVVRVIRHLPTLRRLLARTRAYLAEARPDVVVLIDYPGWHFVVARAARQLGLKVVHFVAPQLWAWAPWRIRKVRERVDRLLVVFPFEEVYFRERGVDARYVGHPLMDRLAEVEASLPPPPPARGSPAPRPAARKPAAGMGSFASGFSSGPRRSCVNVVLRWRSRSAARASRSGPAWSPWSGIRTFPPWWRWARRTASSAMPRWCSPPRALPRWNVRSSPRPWWWRMP